STSPSLSWPSQSELAEVLAGAARNVPDNALSGTAEGELRAFTRERIDDIQHRQLDDGQCMHRLVHNRQLHGGAVEMHWNPNLEKLVDLFGLSSMGGIIRVSDASNEANPDGKSMFGMALELVGNQGQVTDILMTGGSPRTEVSQARDPESQLALFNMLDHPNKVVGLAQMAWEVGPLTAGRMVVDVGRMKTNLDSLAELTAWSRAPFRLTGKDGNDYLVKMRATPAAPIEAGPTQGATSAERLGNEFLARTTKQETRWKFELQFMQPQDDPNDGREQWSGPWVTAAEIVVPRAGAQATQLAEAAEETKFNIWKGKEPHNPGPDAKVFYPHGKTNQARLWAYGQSAHNRGLSS
ncbi:MAG: hypothetical protein KC910_35140, partial [Candidatus Eremiobacteraeota bacterium]|nr:hypothetical protein [Candidatus Eremiobacteraeota bacterium]